MSMVTCSKCKRKLRNINAWHYCEEVDIDDLFIGKSDDIVLIFDAILQEVAGWENVDVSATKNCVVFLRNKTFLIIKPMKKWLEVKFHSKTIIEDDTLHKCNVFHSKFECIVRFTDERQVTSKFFKYFKASYLIS